MISIAQQRMAYTQESERLEGRLALPATATSAVPAAWGLAIVEAALGYEWLLSGLNKVLNPAFAAAS
jgi:hypothetical protein